MSSSSTDYQDLGASFICFIDMYPVNNANGVFIFNICVSVNFPASYILVVIINLYNSTSEVSPRATERF